MRKLLSFTTAAAFLAAGIAFAGEPASPAPTAKNGMFVTAKGMTLYTFDKDEAGKSNCYDKCATNWPPLKAEADAKAEGDWTVVDRTDGTRMWAYEGHPLYTFVKDTKAGDTTGEGVGGVAFLNRKGDHRRNAGQGGHQHRRPAS